MCKTSAESSKVLSLLYIYIYILYYIYIIYITFVCVKPLRAAILVLFQGVNHKITFAIHSPVFKCFSMLQKSTSNKKV
jgi:hypothetical protein